jgi:hypothetical protein
MWLYILESSAIHKSIKFIELLFASKNWLTLFTLAEKFIFFAFVFATDRWKYIHLSGRDFGKKSSLCCDCWKADEYQRMEKKFHIQSERLMGRM